MTVTDAHLSDREFDACTPLARTDALVRAYDNEFVVWSPDAGRPIHLDPVAAVVFQLLDGSARLVDLIADIHEVIGVPAQVARNQLRRVVRQLEEAALLGGPGPATERVSTELGEMFPGPVNH